MSTEHCIRCGGNAAVIDNDAMLCGSCFLVEALRRRRRLSPAPRWRMRRGKLVSIPAIAGAAAAATPQIG